MPETRAQREAPSFGHPAPADRVQQANEAIVQGLAAFARGDAVRAIESYRVAQALVPEANLPYRYEAEAQASLGRWEEAIVSYEKYLAANPNVSDRDQVLLRMEELRAKTRAVAALTTLPAGAAVFLDGSATSSGRTPLDLPLAPGPHRVRVHADGYADASVALAPAAGGRVEAFVQLVRQEGVAGSGRDDAKPRASSTRTMVGFASAFAGAALLGAAGVLDATWVRARIDAFDDARSRGEPAASDAFRSVRTAQTTTIVVLLAGAVLGATSAALLLWPRGAAESRPR